MVVGLRPTIQANMPLLKVIFEGGGEGFEGGSIADGYGGIGVDPCVVAGVDYGAEEGVTVHTNFFQGVGDDSGFEVVFEDVERVGFLVFGNVFLEWGGEGFYKIAAHARGG